MDVKSITSGRTNHLSDTKGDWGETRAVTVDTISKDWGIETADFRKMADGLYKYRKPVKECENLQRDIQSEMILLRGLMATPDPSESAPRPDSLTPKIQQAEAAVEALEGRVAELDAEVEAALAEKVRAGAAFAAANKERSTKGLSNDRKTKLNKSLPGLRSASSKANDVHMQKTKLLEAAKKDLGNAKFRLSELQAQKKNQEARPSPRPIDTRELERRLKFAEERYSAVSKKLEEAMDAMSGYINDWIEENINPDHPHLDKIRNSLHNRVWN